MKIDPNYFASIVLERNMYSLQRKLLKIYTEPSRDGYRYGFVGQQARRGRSIHELHTS